MLRKRRAVFVSPGLRLRLPYLAAMRFSLRTASAAVAAVAAALVLGAIQAASAIALRADAATGSWPSVVPPGLAGSVDRLAPSVPIPAALRLVLAREALARGDVGTATVDVAALPPSRDRLALTGRLAEERGDTTAALRAYLDAGDLADVEAAIAALQASGHIPAALAVQKLFVSRLEADRTQADALAQAVFDVGRLEETQAYQLAVGSPQRHAHEVASGDAYARAVALAPLDERYLIAYANQQINLHEFADAERTFERARDADPTSAEPLAGLGAVAAERGDRAAARALLARARALDPASDAVRNLARALGA